jgi:cell division protein FtsZ
MSNAGSALMGIGSARGENRAVEAAELAVSSPLLEESIDGAQGVLLSIAGGSDLGLFEINEAAAMVSDAVHAEANIIFGATIDDALGDEVRVTVIAAGFEGGRPKRRDEGSGLRRTPVSQPTQTQEETRAAARAVGEQRRGDSPAQSPAPSPAPSPAQSPAQSPAREPVTVGAQQRPAQPPRPTRQVDFDDDLDVPDFLK